MNFIRYNVDLNVKSYHSFFVVHFHRIVHRDIKPSNLLLGDDGHIKVVLSLLWKARVSWAVEAPPSPVVNPDTNEYLDA